MARAIGALAVALALACTSVACGTEPLDVAQNVDLSRFQGKWYEIARLPRSTQTDCHGTTAFYTQGSDGTLALVNQCNVGDPTGPLKTVTMSAKVPDPTVPAKLALDVGGYTGDYWILEVGLELRVRGHRASFAAVLLDIEPHAHARPGHGAGRPRPRSEQPLRHGAGPVHTATPRGRAGLVGYAGGRRPSRVADRLLDGAGSAGRRCPGMVGRAGRRRDGPARPQTRAVEHALDYTAVQNWPF